MFNCVTKNPNLQEIASNPELLAERVELWSEDFLLWFWDCVYTKDEGAGIERIAPRFAYIKSLHETIESERVIWVEKSRQQFVTWYMVARYLWKLMYGRDIRLIYGSRVENDVRDVIRSRFKEMYNRLDRAFPIPDLKFTGLDIQNISRGTIMTGMSSSGEGSRGKTGAELWLDEIAFQAEQENLIRSSMESLNSPGSRIIGVTTPNPKPEAESTKKMIAKSIDGKIAAIELSRGVTKRYNIQGHCILSISHWAHPEKQEDWRERKIKEVGEINFSLEHGLNWEVAKGSPAFWGFDLVKYVVRDDMFDPMLPLLIGVDPGTGHPSVTYFQRGRDRKCRVLHAFTREQCDISSLNQHIERDIVDRFGGHGDFSFYIDPAGARSNPHGTEIAAQVIYNHFGRDVMPAPTMRVIERVKIINDLFSNGMILVQEGCGEYFYADGTIETGAFIYMLTAGYATNSRGEPIKDNTWDHFADSFGYGIVSTFDVNRDIGQKSEAEFSVRPGYYDKLILKKKQSAKTFLEI